MGLFFNMILIYNIFVLGGDTQMLKLKCYSNMGTLSCKQLPLQQLLLEQLVSD